MTEKMKKPDNKRNHIFIKCIRYQRNRRAKSFGWHIKKANILIINYVIYWNIQPTAVNTQETEKSIHRNKHLPDVMSTKHKQKQHSTEKKTIYLQQSTVARTCANVEWAQKKINAKMFRNKFSVIIFFLLWFNFVYFATSVATHTGRNREKEQRRHHPQPPAHLLCVYFIRSRLFVCVCALCAAKITKS